MAEFTLDGRLKVKTLKTNFKENFGATLRVYKNVSCKGGFADDDATLASIRAEGCKGGDLVVKGNMQVGNFEKKVAELYGIGVQVATPDDSELVDNSMTLAKVKDIETLYDVVLVSPGESKLGVIRATSDLLGIGLTEARSIVDNVPSTIRENVTLVEAESLQHKMEEKGATVSIKHGSKEHHATSTSNELALTGSKTILTLKKEFNQRYPYLLIYVCFPAAKDEFERNGIQYEVGNEKTIEDVRWTKSDATISITGNKKIKTVEKELQEALGLFVKVGYRETVDCAYPTWGSAEEKTLSELNELCEKRGCIKYAWK